MVLCPCLQGSAALQRIASFLGAGPANRSGQWVAPLTRQGKVADNEAEFWQALLENCVGLLNAHRQGNACYRATCRNGASCLRIWHGSWRVAWRACGSSKYRRAGWWFFCGVDGCQRSERAVQWDF